MTNEAQNGQAQTAPLACDASEQPARPSVPSHLRISEPDHAAPPDRVALLVHELCGGGAEQVMAQLASAMAAKGLDVDLVAMRPAGPNRRHLSSAVRVIDLQAPRLWRGIRPLATYLRQVQPKAMLSALAYTNVAAVLARRFARSRTRLVVSEHTCPEYEHRHSQRWRIRTAHRLTGWAYRHADAVVAVSDGVAAQVMRRCGLPADRVRRIYNPIRGVDAAAAAEPVGHPWLDDARTPTILAAGRLTAVKNFATLIRALAALRRRTPARLVILGEGPLRDELTALARSLGVAEAVDLPGYVSEVHPWLARAAVVAMSSVSESFGNVIAEAMACGTPVVATDCPTGPAEILEGGRHGRLVPVGDAEAMAKALEAALADPGDLAAARRRTEAFSVDRIVEAYLDVLNVELPR